MIKRSTIIKAAEAVEGVPLLLPEKFDPALAGYTTDFHQETPEGDRRMVIGIYDYDTAVAIGCGGITGTEAVLDGEDAILDAMRLVRIDMHGARPILIHTANK